MALTDDDIQPQMTRRRPGQSAITTPRDEKDRVEIQSGTEFGITLGTPIGLRVMNENQRKQDYGNKTMDLYPRPSHADWTYLEKYGVKASSGGGRSSARETIGELCMLGEMSTANDVKAELQLAQLQRNTCVKRTASKLLPGLLPLATSSSSLRLQSTLPLPQTPNT
jgi:chorismate synthase